MQPLRNALPFALLLSLSCTGFDAGEVELAQAPPQPIVGGIVDQGHGYVVGVGNSQGIFCSGTVVSQRTVVTAGHCVGGISRVYFGVQGSQTVQAVQTVRHPGFSNQTLANDVAVVRLGADAPVQPAPLLRETMTNTPAFIGPNFTFVGYGLTENNGFGTRRVVTFPIDKVGPANVGGTAGQIDATQIYYRPVGKNTCGGDSGGPSFAIRAGVERLAGVTSFGDGPCEFDGVNGRTDGPQITSFIQAQIDAFEPMNACRNDGTCNEACNTGGQVGDADCHAAHCAADGICALACVMPLDPDCSDGVDHCGADGVCDPGCTGPSDSDCSQLGGGGADAGVPDAMPATPDAAVPGTPDAAPPGTPDAGDVGAPDAGDDGNMDDDPTGDCGCRAGGEPSTGGRRLPMLLLFGAILGALVLATRRR